MPAVPYEKFIKDITAEINYAREKKGETNPIKQDLVREVLRAMPSGFIDMDEGDWVKTPLGVFRVTRRKTRPVRVPNSTEVAEVPPALVVKLRPGGKLRHEI